MFCNQIAGFFNSNKMQLSEHFKNQIIPLPNLLCFKFFNENTRILNPSSRLDIGNLF